MVGGFGHREREIEGAGATRSRPPPTYRIQHWPQKNEYHLSTT